MGNIATPLLRDFLSSLTDTMRVCAPSPATLGSVCGSSGARSTGLKLKATGPSEIESPSLSDCLPATFAPLTMVPFDEPRSSMKNDGPSTLMRACFRDTPAS